MDHYATCLDSSYLPRGLALHESLEQHAGPFRLWVLCLDSATLAALRRLDLSQVVAIAEHEVLDAELLRVRAGRSRREYYFATKPWLLRHVLCADLSIERVTFLDGDVYFFDDPAPLMAEISGTSAALSPHRSGDDAFEERFGRFNAGWVSFARTEAGLAALEWWRAQCAEATPDYPIDGRFGEQKYLEELPERFDGVIELRHPGANVAPWNLRGKVDVHAGGLTIDGVPLVFFHFQGAERWARRVHAFRAGRSPREPVLREHLYLPYVRAWAAGERAAAVRRRPAPWGSSRPRPWWWRWARVVLWRSRALAAGRVMVHRH